MINILGIWRRFFPEIHETVIQITSELNHDNIPRVKYESDDSWQYVTKYFYLNDYEIRFSARFDYPYPRKSKNPTFYCTNMSESNRLRTTLFKDKKEIHLNWRERGFISKKLDDLIRHNISQEELKEELKVENDRIEFLKTRHLLTKPNNKESKWDMRIIH